MLALKTTDVDPPGRRAPKKPTAAQKAVVQATLRQHQDELLKMERAHVAALVPLLNRAQVELTRKLTQWIHRAPNGDLRFTAWKYRAALAGLKNVAATLERDMQAQLPAAGRDAQRLSLHHLTNEVARFSSVFGDELPAMRLNLAGLLAHGHATMVQHYRSSAERYAWGSKTGVWRDLKDRLAIEVLHGSSLSETVDRLQEQGGPRGLVATRGVAGEEGAVIELIPEGLFKRYRWRAEMYVRTEMAAAYGAQTRQGYEAARLILPDLQRRWCTDGSGCELICQPMDGQVVGANDNFVTGDGMVVDHDGGAHPNCRCRWCCWRAHWPQLLDSLGIH